MKEEDAEVEEYVEEEEEEEEEVEEVTEPKVPKTGYVEKRGFPRFLVIQMR